MVPIVDMGSKLFHTIGFDSYISHQFSRTIVSTPCSIIAYHFLAGLRKTSLMHSIFYAFFAIVFGTFFSYLIVTWTAILALLSFWIPLTLTNLVVVSIYAYMQKYSRGNVHESRY